MPDLGGISERPDVDGRIRYQVRVRRGGRYQTATFDKLAQAIAWRDQARDAAAGQAELPALPERRPLPQPPGRVVTVGEAARRLCRGMVDGSIRARDGRPYKPSVVRKYEEALRCTVLPRLGAVPIATLTSGDVQRLVDAIAAERTPEHGLGGDDDRGALLGCEDARWPLTPGARRHTHAGAGVGRELAVALGDAQGDTQCRQGLAREDALRGRSFAGPLLTLAFGSGARLGELLALPWGLEGLDLELGVLRVRRSVDRVRDATGLYPFVAPKSRASRRDVPLAPEDVACVRRHRLASGRPPDGALVFGSEEGEALSPFPAERAFKRAARAAGLAEPLPRFHDTRHAFATHALAAGLSAHAVAALLGHTDASLVWRRYGHALPDEVAGAGNALSAFRQARGLANA